MAKPSNPQDVMTEGNRIDGVTRGQYGYQPAGYAAIQL